MHEFSIANEVVSNVLRTTERNRGRKVLSIQLEIGELTHLNGEQVVFWVKELFKNSIAEDAEVKIKTIKTRIHCKACGYRGGIKPDRKDSFEDLGFQTCPQCNSFQFKVEKGRECILKRIQVMR